MRVSGLLCVFPPLLLNWIYCGVALNQNDEDWLDPDDMLNYDAATQTMRKPTEASSFSNVPTKRRQYSSESCDAASCPDMKDCINKLNMLQREVEAHRGKSFPSHQPTCQHVFKRFLSKLLKGIEKLGLPSDGTSVEHYDADVILSKRMVSDIKSVLNDESTCKTGALDEALSQMLVNFRPHDHETWIWRFEDTFGLELETVLKVAALILIIVAVICTELWSMVSWFIQFKRMFAVSFFISLIWNWFYLYKIAFAEHQAKIIKMENVNDKCTGVKKIDWMDNLKEWFRTTWTLQDDPCRQYYEVLIVNPILLVPPTKAITVTMTAFITDPLKQLGQGISDFLRALLKDLPITLQIPVLICIVLAIVVFMYSSGQAAIHHAVFPRLRGGRREPPPGIDLPAHNLPLREEEEEYHLAGGDANHALEVIRPNRRINNANNENRQENHQRRHRTKERRVHVETIRNADRPYSADETDIQTGAAAEVLVEQEPQTDSAEERTENVTADSEKMEHKQPETSPKKDSRDSVDALRSRNEGNEVKASAAALDAPGEVRPVESIGTPVQETMQ